MSIKLRVVCFDMFELECLCSIIIVVIVVVVNDIIGHLECPVSSKCVCVCVWTSWNQTESKTFTRFPHRPSTSLIKFDRSIAQFIRLEHNNMENMIRLLQLLFVCCWSLPSDNQVIIIIVIIDWLDWLCMFESECFLAVCSVWIDYKEAGSKLNEFWTWKTVLRVRSFILFNQTECHLPKIASSTRTTPTQEEEEEYPFIRPSIKCEDNANRGRTILARLPFIDFNLNKIYHFPLQFFDNHFSPFKCALSIDCET